MKKAFKNSDFEALLDQEVQGLVKNKKWSTKVLKRECNQLLTRGVTGDYYKDFKPQPLFFDHNTIREKRCAFEKDVKKFRHNEHSCAGCS